MHGYTIGIMSLVAKIRNRLTNPQTLRLATRIARLIPAALSPIHHPLENLIVYLQWKMGAWSEENLFHARTALERHPTVTSAELYLRFMRDAGGINEHTLKLVEQIIDQKKAQASAAFSTLMSSLYLETGLHEQASRHCINALQRDVNSLNNSLSLSLFAHNHHLPVSQLVTDSIEKRRTTLARLRYTDRNFLNKYRGASIAIVGNSSHEINQQKGLEIDQHDVVIRFNNFQLDRAYARDYGKRTSIWIRSPSLDEVPDRALTDLELIIFSGCSLQFKNNTFWSSKMLNSESVAIAVFHNKLVHKITRLLEAPPTAGILTLYLLLSNANLFSKLSIYGFDFNQGDQYHYFANNSASQRHNWYNERLLYRNLLKENSEDHVHTTFPIDKISL